MTKQIIGRFNPPTLAEMQEVKRYFADSGDEGVIVGIVNPVGERTEDNFLFSDERRYLTEETLAEAGLDQKVGIISLNGTPDEIIAQLRTLVENFGLDGTILPDDAGKRSFILEGVAARDRGLWDNSVGDTVASFLTNQTLRNRLEQIRRAPGGERDRF